MAVAGSGAAKRASNLMFSHMGLSVTKIVEVQNFYARGLGFTVNKPCSEWRKGVAPRITPFRAPAGGGAC